MPEPGIPSISCDRCGRSVPWRQGGWRLWMKPNVDRGRTSVGFFICNACADSFAIWIGQYGSEDVDPKGRGPVIVEQEQQRERERVADLPNTGFTDDIQRKIIW